MDPCYIMQQGSGYRHTDIIKTPELPSNIPESKLELQERINKIIHRISLRPGQIRSPPFDRLRSESFLDFLQTLLCLSGFLLSLFR